ncbi:hypothetical protein BpHYR1_010685 [Brachionus plicatilis]|uniref:Uncharacterized protein n=1 Tax=Brachionus plicatilis TaxID=10195 RepID=A0A3M7SV59_BRAPC|nr:hypothetical protein BpHYR1_010685 [Brachionus plicatilis]
MKHKTKDFEGLKPIVARNIYFRNNKKNVILQAPEICFWNIYGTLIINYFLITHLNLLVIPKTRTRTPENGLADPDFSSLKHGPGLEKKFS